MKGKFFSTIILLLFTINIQARPAAGMPVPYIQPDGSKIIVYANGDEFFHFLTTEDGCIVTKGEDGWLCYGRIEENGTLVCSEVRVSAGAPATVIAASRRIPSEALSSNRRMKMQRLAESIALKGTRPGLSGKEWQEGDRYALVILAQYKDIGFRYTKEDFVNMLTQKGYSQYGATGCAAEYFDAQFNRKVNFHFDVSDIVTLKENRRYYGQNKNGQDHRPEEMIVEACKLADPNIDFSKYDGDGDQIVDNVFVFFAGVDEAETQEEDAIWSHAYYIHSGSAQIDLVLDGMRIDRYACTSELTHRKHGNTFVPELAGIGTFCHEYSHTFGLPDFYDTDYTLSGGTAKAMWRSLSLMDAGNTNNESNTPPFYNAIERVLLGLSVPETIDKEGTYRLEPIHLNGKCYRINTSNPDEYYLLECRYPEKWDQFCGGQGLLVYHIDRSNRPAGYSETYGLSFTARQRWEYNEVNCRPDRECAAIHAAEETGVSNVFFPRQGISNIYGSDMRFWDGGHSHISIHNISREGKDITFTVNINEEDTIYPLNISHETFQNSAIVTFESSVKAEKTTVTWGTPGGESQSEEITEYSPNKYSCKIWNLEPNTKYIINIIFNDSSINRKQISTITKKHTPIPLISLGKEDNRKEDGFFRKNAKLPLEVLTPQKPCKVEWKFNGKNIRTGQDHYYPVTESGVLEATVWYRDGRIENIVKEIKMK